MEEKKYITVFSSSKARRLLKDGFSIVDIKPDKNDWDKKRTLFIFERSEEILKRLKK